MIPNILNIRPFMTGKGQVTSEACLLCQKPIKDWGRSASVHCVEGTVTLIVPAAQDYTDEAADMGWWPVGPECAKKLPAGYVHA